MQKKWLTASILFFSMIIVFFLTRGKTQETALHPAKKHGNKITHDQIVPKKDIIGSDKKSWIIEYTSLSSEEEKEFSIVPTEIKNFFTKGRIDPEKLDDFRAAVYKYDNRGLAHIGRTLIFASEDLTKTRDGADQVVSLIDTLAYFGNARKNYPLSIDIIREIGTRPIEFKSELSPEEKSRSNITIQVFELYAKYEPEEAARFILTNIEKNHRDPYIGYYRTGLALAGLNREEIAKKLAIFI